MQYVDSSALVKRYLRELDSAIANGLLDADREWVTSAITEVEVRRVLAIRLAPDRLATVRSRLLRDLERTAVVAVDATTVGLAASLAEATGVRSLDALHLASMQRLASRAMRLVTFDVRMAAAARDLGISVLGA
jgi:predicted nucleic acid-binding protein